MSRHIAYPAELTPAPEGGFVVTFPDVQEAITQGDDLEGALYQAADCLDEAIAGRMLREEDIPRPSRPSKGQYLVALPAQMAARAALYLALREAGISQSELARRLGCDVREVRRLLDPTCPLPESRIFNALNARFHRNDE